MRRALATALMFMAAPATVLAAKPYKDKDLTPTPLLDKALFAHQRAHKARQRHAVHAARAARAARRRVAVPGYLAAIAACESGSNPSAIGGGGLYRGAFQMTYATWQSLGGSGDPAAAPMSEQVRRAALLYARSGPGQWPVCAQ